MDSIVCLCIGGVLDGQQIAIPSHVWDFRAPNFHGLKAERGIVTRAGFDTVHYKRQQLAASEAGKVYNVLVLDELTTADALELLLANYRPKGKQENED